MDMLKTMYQDDHFRLGRCHLAVGRAWRIWRIQGMNQPKATIPCHAKGVSSSHGQEKLSD